MRPVHDLSTKHNLEKQSHETDETTLPSSEYRSRDQSSSTKRKVMSAPGGSEEQIMDTKNPPPGGPPAGPGEEYEEIREQASYGRSK